MDTPEAAGVLGQVVEQGIEEVVKDQMGPKYWAALRALEALGRMRRPSAVKVLADTLKTRPANRYVTQTAAAALARQGGGAAIRALVDCLDEDRPPHRREIIWALLRLQPHSLRPVLGTLANTESDVVRRNALRVLGYADEVPPGSAEEILKCLDSSDASVRAEAAWACGKHRIAEAADRLKGLLADADENVRLDAQQALQRLGQ